MNKIFNTVKITAIALLCIVITYTYTKRVEGYNIRNAVEFCDDKDGIQDYYVFVFESVTCANGDTSKIKNLK